MRCWSSAGGSSPSLYSILFLWFSALSHGASCCPHSRVWVRIREVEESMRLIEQILKRLPEGPILQPLHARAGMREGLGIVEGFRGDVLVWIRLDGDRVSRCHVRDPSWFQWPLLEAVIEGNIVADFPLCNKSFNG